MRTATAKPHCDTVVRCAAGASSPKCDPLAMLRHKIYVCANAAMLVVGYGICPELRAESDVAKCRQSAGFAADGNFLPSELVTSDAIDVCERAARVFPGNADVLAYLGRALYRNGRPDDAYLTIQKSAQLGSVVGRMLAGVAYSYGIGVSVDLVKAAAAFEAASAQNSASAQTNLANMYLSGAGVRRDVSRAVRLLEAAVDQGYYDAQIRLARFVESRVSEPGSSYKALDLYSRAMSQGSLIGRVELGRLKHALARSNHDRDEALALAKAGLHSDLPYTSYLVGQILIQRGTRADLTEANAHFATASSSETSARVELGKSYLLGRGVPVDHRRAAEWFVAASEGGNEEGKVWLASLRIRGLGVPLEINRALAELQDLASRDNSFAQSWLGWAYAQGLAGDTNRSYALHWYKRAADQGDVAAQMGLARAYEHGNGTERDVDTAAKWYASAAAAGSREAKIYLATWKLRGIGVTKQIDAGLSELREEAERGDVSAQSWLGWAYAKGLAGDENKSHALRWYKRAADQGDVTAQMNLARAYEHGNGTERDVETAAKWYASAAAAGSREAKIYLATWKLRGIGVTKQIDAGLSELREEAERGDVSAQSWLGWAYAKGLAGDENKSHALRWYKRAADQGDVVAQLNLAAAYKRGEGIQRNPAEAARLYASAASVGSREAKAELAILKLVGLGVPRQTEIAIKELTEEAEGSNALAQYLLGWAYGSGHIGAEDQKKRRYWYERAALNNSPVAAFELGDDYFYGSGGVETVDISVASVWYDRAARAGYDEARFYHAICLVDGINVAQEERDRAQTVLAAFGPLNVQILRYRNALIRRDPEASSKFPFHSVPIPHPQTGLRDAAKFLAAIYREQANAQWSDATSSHVALAVNRIVDALSVHSDALLAEELYNLAGYIDRQGSIALSNRVAQKSLSTFLPKDNLQARAIRAQLQGLLGANQIQLGEVGPAIQNLQASAIEAAAILNSGEELDSITKHNLLTALIAQKTASVLTGTTSQGKALSLTGSAFRDTPANDVYAQMISALTRPTPINAEAALREFLDLAQKSNSAIAPDANSRLYSVLASATAAQGEDRRRLLQSGALLASAQGTSSTLRGAVFSLAAEAEDDAMSRRTTLLYAALAVEAWEEQRTHVRMTLPASEVNYVRMREDVYRILARALARDGRILDSEAVLRLLRERQLDLLVRDAPVSIENDTLRSFGCIDKACTDRGVLAGRAMQLATDLATARLECDSGGGGAT